jgi:hypothetical protein
VALSHYTDLILLGRITPIHVESDSAATSAFQSRINGSTSLQFLRRAIANIEGIIHLSASRIRYILILRLIMQ